MKSKSSNNSDINSKKCVALNEAISFCQKHTKNLLFRHLNVTSVNLKLQNFSSRIKLTFFWQVRVNLIQVSQRLNLKFWVKGFFCQDCD